MSNIQELTYMKHAYLIIAHNQYEQLKLLVSLLDNPCNDIYIHIDRKSSEPKESFKCKYSKVVLIPNDKRVDVRWGDISQIECELILYETAFQSNQCYSYYHLLSGVDLPIKSMSYIYSFFESHSGTNFIGFGKPNPNELELKVGKRHYFRKHFRENNIAKRLIYKILRLIAEKVGNTIYPSMMDKCIEYKKGANWSCLTNDFVEYLLLQKTYILEHYKRGYCCDEIYKQTLIWNSKFKDTIFNKDDEFYGCMRLIDWQRGRPYTFGADEDKDLRIIHQSDFLFARKFNYTQYPNFIEKILCLIK